jgi:hypothetical protein
MKTERSLRAGCRTGLALLLPLSLLACSGDNEDPRITLCKRLTTDLAGVAGESAWQEPRIEIRRPEYAAVSVAIDGENAPRATCRYAYDLVEESAMDHANPLLAYATLPYEMTLDGTPVPDEELKRATSRAQLAPLRR